MRSFNRWDRANRWAGKRVTPKGKKGLAINWSDTEEVSNFALAFQEFHRLYCAEIGIDMEDLIGPLRVQEIVDARHVAMVAIRRQGATLQETACIFGRVHHTTVLHAEQRVRDQIELYGQGSHLSDLLNTALEVYVLQ